MMLTRPGIRCVFYYIDYLVFGISLSSRVFLLVGKSRKVLEDMFSYPPIIRLSCSLLRVRRFKGQHQSSISTMIICECSGRVFFRLLMEIPPGYFHAAVLEWMFRGSSAPSAIVTESTSGAMINA
jgi:hypothetical protein